MGRETYDGGNTTGFVSPAGDSLEGPIDLSEVLDLRRPHRYLVRVDGDLLRHRGIHHDDILVADASMQPRTGVVVIAMVAGDVLTCELRWRDGQWWLQPSGPAEAIAVAEGGDVEIWAVAAALVRTEL